jgi:hypothetical protein
VVGGRESEGTAKPYPAYVSECMNTRLIAPALEIFFHPSGTGTE